MPFPESLKLSIKKKAHFQCCLCHSLGIEVHHIVPEGTGGPDTEDNAAPLCPSCHETYGANREKRKFVREARDFWYEICAERYASDKSILDRIAQQTKGIVSKQDLETAVERILGFNEVRERALSEDPAGPDRRSDIEILEALEELFDKIWYNRHKGLMYDVENGRAKIDPEILVLAKRAAKRVEKKWGKKNLDPWDDFEWGMLNGKMSALRWVLGDEWDFLDT
jgi:hypothetical protein